MARKNGLKNDSLRFQDGPNKPCTSYPSAPTVFLHSDSLDLTRNTNTSLTFNTRTKAVMADVVQDNIKEKVTSVREVVSGKSNNEIVLVLQYYDYDVEKTIQAYLEGGAKEALQQWQFSGTKPVKKKRNKKKATNVQSSEVPRSPESVSSESGSAVSFMVNGSREPVINGILDHEPDISRPSKNLSNGPTTSSTYQVPTPSPPSVPVVSNTIVSSSNSSIIDTSTSGTSAEVKVTSELRAEDKGAKEKSPSPQPQRHHHSHHHNRPRTHSGSHGHSEGRDRTTSTSSIGSQSGKKHAHLGLERSAKDLHRQTVSLERLRLIFIEEVDKSHKRIKSVFDEIRLRLNAKENLLTGQLNDLKQAGDDVFTMRQGFASDLKVQIDRAERMSEDELAALRLEIKHFVSDRKVDEDLAKTIRFMYDDKLKDDIGVFGEIVPLKCPYVQERSNFSTRKPEVDKKEAVHIPKPAVDKKPSSDSRKKTSTSSHLDSSQTEEMAQLQRRLKHSLTLEGIPVESFPERPETAPEASTVKTNNSPRPDSARRNYNRNRRRNDRPRPESAKEDNRSSFNQTPGGERVILIGRKTGPQGGGPGRGRGAGGRGRGRGRGGYSGMGRGQSNNTDNVNNSNNGQNESSPSESRGPSASPPKPQRENSNRRGSGRGSGGNSGRRGNSNPGGGSGNSSKNTNRPDSNTNENKEG